MVRRPMVSGLVLALLPALALPVTASLFTERSETAVSNAPWNLTGGDLDGDGDLDLVVCHAGDPGVVTVILNDGTGRFAEAAGSPIGTIRFPNSAAIGSFNPRQDPFPDLVVVSNNDSFSRETGSLLLGDGTGRFRLQESFDIGQNGGIGQTVVAADFDGDGDDDVVFGNGQVFLGSGSALIHGTDLPVVSPAFSVLAGDFDGDGHPDAAFPYGTFVQDSRFGHLQIFLSVRDTGTFVEAPGSPMDLGMFPETMAAADFDGDGDLELAVTEFGNRAAHILLNEGDGRLVRVGYAFVRSTYPRGIATADFDGDGHADLAVGYIVGSDNGGAMSLLLGDGAGGFTQIDESPRVDGPGPFSIVAADLNWDGKPDLAAGDVQNDAIAVFLHTPPPFLEVAIDVLPGSDDNVIRLGSQGSLPVAILSTEGFDAATVIPASVRLAGAAPRLDAKGDPACHSEDVNRDHQSDLLCLVDKAAVGLQPGDTVAVLLATTLAGTAVRGQDTVRVLGGKAPHLPSTTRWPAGVTSL